MLAKLYIALLLLFSSSSCSFQTIITFSLSLSLSLALPELRSLHLLYFFSSYYRKRNMVRKRDRFWEYAEDLKGRFKCKFCERDFAGGASRIKCHLAGVKGHDIDICTKVFKEVQEKAALIVGEPNKKLKGASTSNRDKGREINSTSISKDVTLSRVFEKSNEEYSTEIDLSVAVEGLLAKVRSLVIDHIGSGLGDKEKLIELLVSLSKIQVVLQDTEKWQITDEPMRNRLAEFREVVYDADDVLDEFEILKQEVQSQNQIMESVENKMKTIIDRLLELDTIKNGLRVGSMDTIPKISLDREVDSNLNDLEIVGRGYDVSKIVNMLTNASNQCISVLPIVGMAGLGKTTLAKEVYNNELIRKHFDVLAWACVTKNFNRKRILREILQSIDGNDHLSYWYYLRSVDEILSRLQIKLCGNKYLLVLDDVWIDDHEEWSKLRSNLLSFNSMTGNNIIVTTCSDKVANLIGTPQCQHYLEQLSKDECWSIFEKRAFANKKITRTRDLESIGREIAKRSEGFPLAAKVLGGIMCFKYDKSEWLSIQNNKIWDSLDDDTDRFFRILRLSFDNLPTPSLKQCFAYCANFQDYNIRKDDVIQRWMAEGFLESSKGSCMMMEDIGNLYFNILLVTSFFQDARKDEYGNIISCKMHDLVHDFALSILKSKTLILEGASMDDVGNAQCLFIRFVGQTTQRISFIGDGFTKLRSLVSDYADFGSTLSNFKSLRVLKLYGGSIIELPDSIEHLIHLRLLHISHANIKTLPKSVTKLYKLQTLTIKKCFQFVGLPEELSNLINLRHIYIDKVPLRMPKNMGLLTCLQTLPIFVVGQDEGHSIEELGALKNLRGEIDIYNLGFVEDGEEAKSAKLKEKEIFKLGLYNYWDEEGYWDEEEEDYRDKDEKVLEGLQPHRNLKSLTIEGYGGKKFPSWVGLSLHHNLIEIKLGCFKNCEEVPTLGHLPCLRVLEISEMKKVRCLGSEFYSDESCKNTILFPALRILKLEAMGVLEEWKDAKELTSAGEVLVFPCLEKLTLFDCPKLRYLPDSLNTCTSLQKLEVGWTGLRYLPGVPSYIIRRGIEDLPTGSEYLENWDCLPSSSSSSIQLALQSLKFTGPDTLLGQIQYFTALKILWIGDYYEMVDLPEWLGNISSLQQLYLVNCPYLVHLPTKEAMQRLTQLKKLVICGCPKFEHNERIKISHVPWVEINSPRWPYCKEFRG
ncbi:putative disease resistance protein RGA4 isoform X2 [Quercus robur]|uniref:putative disease resistance protein RGA4 isoform X2 n=1 Tax=Quercus robur TaxID=38942 RepID=UPI002162DE96|nr:putative disease resistance protein RGA4 isoform X2 [Quercus robur]